MKDDLAKMRNYFILPKFPPTESARGLESQTQSAKYPQSLGIFLDISQSSNF